MNLVVGVAEMKVSNRATDVIVTYSLGSCVGLTLFDPVRCVGGMIHCMLPLSNIDPEKAKLKPEMFTDTGVPGLLQMLFSMGAEKKNLVAKVAGAANLLDAQNIFRIGERNYNVLKKLLEKNGIPIAGEDVGGTVARTIYLNMTTGQTTLKCCGKEMQL